MLVGLALLACSEGEPTDSRQTNRFDGSWVDSVARRPETFGTLVAANREGWIAFHRNDWQSSVTSGGDPATRAHRELAAFYRTMSQVNTDAWFRVDDLWSARGLSGAKLVHDLRAAAVESEGGELRNGAGSERWALHDRVRQVPTDVSQLIAAAGTPLLTERVDGTDRAFFDPWIFRTLTGVEGASVATVGDETTFSGALLAPGTELSLPAANGEAKSGESAVHDADQCRGFVRTLDAEIEAWETQLGGSVSTEGRTLLDDLRLIDATRSRALVGLAGQALDDHRPGCALALTQLALDHEAPRAISPVNSPTLFAQMAQAELELGHSREALDAIEVLVPHYPAAIALRETIGTLVVLAGLDRQGESRE